MKKDTDNHLDKILCCFSSTPWNSSMIETYFRSGGCDTCGFGETHEVTITCHSCKKIIYKKEYYPNG